MKLLLQARFAELTREASVSVMLNVECSIAEHQELPIEQSLEIRDTLVHGLRASRACRDPAQFRPRARSSGHGTLHEACDFGRFHNELHESCGLFISFLVCLVYPEKQHIQNTPAYLLMLKAQLSSSPTTSVKQRDALGFGPKILNVFQRVCLWFLWPVASHLAAPPSPCHKCKIRQVLGALAFRPHAAQESNTGKVIFGTSGS